MKYDVIIVGAGPAGASAALEFSKSDLHVLVVEKELLPRDKPCGGAMPSTVEKLLDLDLSEVIKNRTNTLKLYHNYKDKVQSKTIGTGAPLLVDRREFDHFLLEQALSKESGNIELLEGCKVESINEAEKEIKVVLDNGNKLEAKYLIAADGVLGKVATIIGLMKKKKFALSVDAEIITNSQYYNEHKDTMVMNYFCLPHGYGWIFPKEKNRFSCGVGTWGKPLNLKRELDDFIVRSFSEDCIEKIEIKGYPIPVYQGMQQISTNRVLLTGDAAGLVDPVSGEGIRFALHSGKIAASVISKALKNLELLNNSVSDEYQKEVNEKIGVELKFKLSFISLAFHNNPDLFYKNFIKKSYFKKSF